MNRLGARGSIGRRLTLALIASSTATLLLAFVTFTLYDLSVTRTSLVQNATTLADVIGRNSEIAISLSDPASAEDNLNALRASRAVTGAVVFDGNGDRFAAYVADGSTAQDLPTTMGKGVRFGDDHFDVYQPVSSGGNIIATIAIRTSSHELIQRLEVYASALLLLLILALSVAFATSNSLRKRISDPVAQLARSAESLAAGNLAVELSIDTQDEIGGLAHSFNAMTQSLRGVVLQVRHGISDVSEVAQTLRESGNELALESERQRGVISGASESIVQLGSSILEVNQNVERLADSTRETSSSIVQMDASIRAVAEHMDHLDESIETASIAVSQIAASTDNVVSGVGTLATATGETTVQLRELSRTVSLVEENAKATREISDETSREAANGIAAVGETIQVMHEIAKSFDRLDDSVLLLASKSNSINEILKVIQGVAEQTSLLSLNAAIIASQAGEHGRAFSVVAREISTLATRTKHSARDISDLIAAVQQDTASAVEAAQMGAAVVQQGVLRSNDAGTVLERISEKSRASAERVREISDAASHQNEDLERVNQAMVRVLEMVEQITAITHDQRNATTEIVETVENIRLVAKGVKNSTAEQRKGSQLITQAVTDVAGMVHHIAAATRRQAQSGETIQHALDVLKDASSESAMRSQAVNDMVETLSERATRLEREIRRFDAGTGGTASTR